MPRDVEQTRRRLRDAALVEFAAHGLHGTTVERIAARAGVNKERLYSHFGDKASLFTAVLVDELEAVATALPVEVRSPEEFGELAGRTLDYTREHPDLSRLVLWEGLADTGELPDEATRAPHYAEKVEAIAAAQRAGGLADAIAPHHLMFLMLALTSWWSAAPQMARMLGGDRPDDDWADRRAAVVEAARRMAAPDA